MEVSRNGGFSEWMFGCEGHHPGTHRSSSPSALYVGWSAFSLVRLAYTTASSFRRSSSLGGRRLFGNGIVGSSIVGGGGGYGDAARNLWVQRAVVGNKRPGSLRSRRSGPKVG